MPPPRSVLAAVAVLVPPLFVVCALLAAPVAAQVWAEQAKLVADVAAADEQFGTSVSLWLSTAIIGAHGDAHAGLESGAAYVFTESGNSWLQQQRLNASDAAPGARFGRSVALRLDTAVVGAPGRAGHGGGYVFRRTSGHWNEEDQFEATDADPGDEFGWSVSISGNALVVGAFRDDQSGTDAGAAYLFVRSGSSWVQMAKIVGTDTVAGDSFGYSVSIHNDTVVVGAPGHDALGSGSGAAYVFVRSGAAWVQQAKLLALGGAPFDAFGRSVCISGESLIVGAVGSNVGGSDAGAAYVFIRGGTAWVQQARLLAADPFTDDWFGASVALTVDTAVVGALSVDGAGINSGAAYVFERQGSTWMQQDKLLPPDPDGGDQYGISVTVSGDKILAGASFNDDAGRQSGAAYVHRFLGTGIWQDLGGGAPGSAGTPLLVGAGSMAGGSPVTLDVSQVPPGALMLGWVSLTSSPWAVLGGTLHANPPSSQIAFNANAAGAFKVSTLWPVGLPTGSKAWFQFLVQDGAVPDGITLTNALEITTP